MRSLHTTREQPPLAAMREEPVHSNKDPAQPEKKPLVRDQFISLYDFRAASKISERFGLPIIFGDNLTPFSNLLCFKINFGFYLEG